MVMEERYGTSSARGEREREREVLKGIPLSAGPFALSAFPREQVVSCWGSVVLAEGISKVRNQE